MCATDTMADWGSEFDERYALLWYMTFKLLHLTEATKTDSFTTSRGVVKKQVAGG